MKPGEHKTVQARILAYAEAIGWTVVPPEEAEQRRGFDPAVPPADRAKNRSLFFDDLLDAKVREFNPRYAEVMDPSTHQRQSNDTCSPKCAKPRWYRIPSGGCRREMWWN